MAKINRIVISDEMGTVTAYDLYGNKIAKLCGQREKVRTEVYNASFWPFADILFDTENKRMEIGKSLLWHWMDGEEITA